MVFMSIEVKRLPRQERKVRYMFAVQEVKGKLYQLRLCGTMIYHQGSHLCPQVKLHPQQLIPQILCKADVFIASQHHLISKV